MRASSLFITASAFVLGIPSTMAFSDLPSNHPAYEAVEYLRENGVLTGYSDGTFRPGITVNRAEAIKVIVAPIVSPDALVKHTSSVYGDVSAGSWFLPFVEYARTALGIIEGPPKKTSFNPTQPVTKSEFFKMLLLANDIDPQAYSEIRLPLSNDVTDPNTWYYPYIRYGLSSSMTMITQEGMLYPGKELTRGDVALFLYRFMMYREARRTQALLSEAETELVNVLNALEGNDITQAEYASARALLAARGAHASRGNETIVQAALKIAESFRSLVRAYRAGLNQDFNTVLTLSKEAWTLADRARQLSEGLASIADQIQLSAKNMADSARAMQGGL